MKEFKLIVAGGRDFVDYQRAHAVLFALAEGAGQACAHRDVLMEASEGRPVGITNEDVADWASRYTTPLEIQMAAANCKAWIDACRRRTDPDERARGIQHWEERLLFLRTKALIMGVYLEE